MARAKRTARAEARRRYRAEQGLPDDTLELAEDITEDPAAGRAAARPSADRPPRPSIVGAFRQSFHPLDVRADLRVLPQIATRSRALWLPLALTLLSAIAVAITRGSDIVTMFLFTYFLTAPAIGGVFIAGFLAPRASWALGLIVGLFSVICYTILGVAGVLPPLFQEVFIRITTEGFLYGFLVSMVSAAFFASAAAWYRRFLQLSNPNRGRPQPPARRGGDGRSRSGSNPNQKAGVRR